MDRDPDTLGEIPVKLGLIGLAVPRKTYLQSHLDYLADRLTRLFENKELIKGLKWVYKPPVLRFYEETLIDQDEWGWKLLQAYRRDLGNV